MPITASVVVVLKQGRLIFSSMQDNSVKLWDSDQPGTAPLFSLKGAHTDEVRCFLLSQSRAAVSPLLDDKCVYVMRPTDALGTCVESVP
eukprot:3164868-Rhodomonas_salina.2